LKRLLPILIFAFILLISIPSQGQSRSLAQFAQVPNVSIVNLYPNPATNYITFNFKKNYDKGYSIKVYNFLGKKMYEASNLSQQITINTTEFTRGLYIFQLFDKSGRLAESGKFQVTKS
jgi:hypothetical protein